MNYQTFEINIDYKKAGIEHDDFVPKMSIYLPSNSDTIDPKRKRPTVIICPGGAYAFTSDIEAEPVALKFLSEDCNVVVLRYSVAPSRFPAALLEVSYVVSKLREMAEEWNVDTEKIVVMGFSAGGHVAASYGTLWNKDFIKEYFGFKGGENKPNGMMLCYPVISSGEKAHRWSFNNLLGDKAEDTEMLNLVSAELQVTEYTPPAFIWHTFEDASVPVENSLLMATALAEKKIPLELHIFPRGYHGLSICNDIIFPNYDGSYSEVQVWVDMAVRWLKRL